MFNIGRPTQLKALGLVLIFSLLYFGADQAWHLFEIPQLKTLDLFFKWRSQFVPPQKSIDDITVIALDDESMERLGKQWPYRRSVYAYLVQELVPQQPKIISFDFVFAGEDLPADDKFLADTIAWAGNVVVASFVGPNGRLVATKEEIRKASVGQGVLNKVEDSDKTVRRGSTFYWTDTNPFAAWSWEMNTVLFVKGLDPNSAKVDKEVLYLKGKENETFHLPLLPDRSFDINFKAYESQFRQIPFWKFFSKEYPKEAVTGKIVLVGLTSRLFHDEHPTPLELARGVIMNANALLTLLDQDYLRRVPDIAIKGLGLILALLVGWLTWRLRVTWVIAVVILLVGLSAGASLYALVHNWRADFFTVPFLVIASFLVTSFYKQIASFIENVQLRTLAITDPLTGLYTRRYLDVRLSNELVKARAQRGKHPQPGHRFHEISFFMTDVDHFKSVNDTFGHDEGDRVLKEVARVLKSSARKTDVVARFGGEEFCVILPDTTKEEALKVADKLRQAIENEVKIVRDNQTRVITISVGLASALEDELIEPEKLFKAADTALYHSKESGRNRVTGYHPSI